MLFFVRNGMVMLSLHSSRNSKMPSFTISTSNSFQEFFLSPTCYHDNLSMNSVTKHFTVAHRSCFSSQHFFRASVAFLIGISSPGMSQPVSPTFPFGCWLILFSDLEKKVFFTNCIDLTRNLKSVCNARRIFPLVSSELVFSMWKSYTNWFFFPH